MASDYVRNLRQETIKGLYGRLKQGIYPFGAPVGYRDHGKGELKTICPQQGLLVQEAFRLYASQNYTVLKLAKEMAKRGLRNQRGNIICKNGITRILKNPFYIGLMSVKGSVFEGKHEALIDTRTFNQVQLILKGRTTSEGLKHNYLFRRKITCDLCGYYLRGECQKGHVYYRCQTKGCPTKTQREDVIEYYLRNILRTMTLHESEIKELEKLLHTQTNEGKQRTEKLLQGLHLQKKQLESKEKKLLDTYLENLIEKEEYQSRKKSLLMEMKKLEEQREAITDSTSGIWEKMRHFIELCRSPLKFYDSAIPEEKRKLLEIITSNLVVREKKVMFTMLSPFYEIANRDMLLSSALNRDTQRIETS